MKKIIFLILFVLISLSIVKAEEYTDASGYSFSAPVSDSGQYGTLFNVTSDDVVVKNATGSFTGTFPTHAWIIVNTTGTIIANSTNISGSTFFFNPSVAVTKNTVYKIKYSKNGANWDVKCTTSGVSEIIGNLTKYTPIGNTPDACGAINYAGPHVSLGVSNTTVLNNTSQVSNIQIQTPIYLNTNATVTWNFTNGTGGSGNQKSNVTWYKNSILLAVYTNITTNTHNLTEGNFTVNDQLTAEITPYDGSSSGTKVNSSTITVLLYTNTSQTFQTLVLHGTKQNYNITLSTYFSDDITSFNSIIFNFNGTNYTGYNSSSSSPWIIYTTNVQIPNITTTTTNINGTWYINASTNEGNFNFTFINTTTVSLFGIDNCSVYTQRWVNFTIHDEVTGVTLHQNNLSAYFEYRDRLANYSNFYNISMNNRSNFSFCVIPQWANESVDMLIQYTSEGYDLRDFIVENYVLDNFTEQTELYLLSISQATAVTIHVTDQSDNDKVGVLVIVEKWNIGSNDYETVEAEYTDSNGEAVVQLRLNSDYYRFTVYENGELVLQTIKQKASGAIIPLIITSSGTNIVSEYLTTISAVTRSLTFTNTTNIVNLTYSHNNDNIATVCMRVNNQNGTLSTQCSSNTTGTILYTLTTRNNTHTAVAYVNTDTENMYVLATLDIPALRVWNTLGADKAIGFTLVLFITLALLGVGTTLQSKTGAYVTLGMAWLGLFIPTVFGLLPIGATTMSGITVLFIIIAWVIERK